MATTPILERLKDLLTGIVLAAGNAIIGKVGIDQTTDGTTNKVASTQATHDNLNCNANIQVGNIDVGNANPIPISDGGGSITVDGAITANIGTDAANTSRSTSTSVLPVQNIDSTGKVSPAGNNLANAPYSRDTIYNGSGIEVFTVTNPGVVDFHPGNISAFGTLEVCEFEPVFQSDFVYGLNTQKFLQSFKFTVTAPAVAPLAGDIYSNNNAYFTVVYITGTTLICSGSQVPAASGNLTRVSGAGSTPIAFSAYVQQTGFYYGTGANVDTSSGRARIQSGTTSTGFAYLQSRRPLRYRAGQGNVIRFTPFFTTGVNDNIQIWGMGNVINNAVYDGYFVGYNGTSFGICRYAGGTPNWTAQASFNGDTIDSNGASGFNINTTYGTPWMIKYPFLGYGDIFFYVQNATTGDWILVHTIRYANTTTALQLTNPTMRFLGYTLNSGNTTNMLLYCGSVGVFTSGKRSLIGNSKWAMDNYKSHGGGGNTLNIITIKNCLTYNTVSNQGLVRLQSITVTMTSTLQGTCAIQLIVNATLAGTPSFNAINGTTANNGNSITNGNSIVTYDTAGTTVTGGQYIYNINLGNSAGSGSFLPVDLSIYEIFIGPGETLTVNAVSSVASTIGCSLNWTEDI